jgi:hypothetical protein
MKSNRSFVWVKRKVPPREAAAVRSLGMQGVAFVTETNRYLSGKDTRRAGHRVLRA